MKFTTIYDATKYFKKCTLYCYFFYHAYFKPDYLYDMDAKPRLPGEFFGK